MKRIIRAKEFKKGCLVVALILLTCIISIVLVSIWDKETTNNYSITISVLSAIIAVIALIYAMTTYYSIDKVQAANAMEGNVLSDKMYSIAYTDIIKQYEDCMTEEEFSKELKKHISYKKCRTCQDLAEQLQTMVDNLIWVAYIKDENVIADIRNICLKLKEVSNKEFSDINNGLKHLFEEYIKLIFCVIDYQQERNNNSKIKISSINSIRGEMLRNPIAQVVYYDYLSLEYRYRAESLLELQGSMYSPDNLNRTTNTLKNSERLRFECGTLLNHAEIAIKKASEIAKSNLIWSGYIKYNLARIHLFQYLVQIADNEENKSINKDVLISEIHESFRTRSELLFIVWGHNYNDYIPKDNESFLFKRMKNECDMGNDLDKLCVVIANIGF